MGKKRRIVVAALVLAALGILVWFLAAKAGRRSRDASIDSNATERSQSGTTAPETLPVTNSTTAEELQSRAKNEAPTNVSAEVLSVSTQAQQRTDRALIAPTNQMPGAATVPSAANGTPSDIVLLTTNANRGPRGTNASEPVKIELVRIEPGTFVMGSPQTEFGRDPTEDLQTVVMLTRGFWLGVYEVTVEQYEDVLGAGAATGRDAVGMYLHNASGRNMPVMRLSWVDAINFCSRLTEREREADRLPEGYVYRLPTMAEWQYACRAGTTTRYFFGDDLGGTLLDQYAWYSLNSEGTVHPVGLKKPNPWGLYDMAGNAGEWCLDVYRLPGGEATDPVGTASGPYGPWRGFCGGAWNFRPEGLRSAARRWGIDSRGSIEAGFRVALAPELR